MPRFRVSGSAVPTSVTGDVDPLDDALAGEDGVTVEAATRTGDRDLEFTLEVEAPDEATAVATAQRIADRLSPGSAVTVLGTSDD